MKQENTRVMEIPRPEHPQPQWERKNWINLNGEWAFEMDCSGSAIERQRYKESDLEGRIIVPFCPESKLSGIGYKDFIPAVCYSRSFWITESDLNGRIILHFGASDYKTYVFINGEKAGIHIGGYTPFQFDITDKLSAGSNTVFVYVEDDVRSGLQCRGKQSVKRDSHECLYTRTTGIWQTVWLELVPTNYVKYARFYPDVYNCAVVIRGEVCGAGSLEISVCLDGEVVGSAAVDTNGSFCACIKLSRKLLWEVGKGGLYDVSLSFGDDRVNSYFGLRDIRIDGYKIRINGKSVFQRLVLDQGYYPDGIYTAPTEQHLKRDIQLSMEAGFNGARLHEKVFEPRFFYYADQLGYIVWGEYADWGIKDFNSGNAFADVINGWVEAVERDFNHPSIVGWCPFNETWNYHETITGGRVLETMYKLTKVLDPTRPCIDTSGNYHSITDIYDLHDYDQNPKTFEKRYRAFGIDGKFDTSEYEPDAKPFFTKFYKYKKGMPSFVSEYGGIKWDPEAMEKSDLNLSWGYGNAPKTKEEFIERYCGLTEALLFNPNMFGFCYTQLYDVEQEKNGLFTYWRQAKFDLSEIRRINSQKAKIEES